MLTDTAGPKTDVHWGELTNSLHAAQAQGLLRDSAAVRNLLEGIAGAVIHTVDNNARDERYAWALQSPTYWAHFEMHLKESVLGACAGLDPSLCRAVRDVLDATLTHLQRSYRTC